MAAKKEAAKKQKAKAEETPAERIWRSGDNVSYRMYAQASIGQSGLLYKVEMRITPTETYGVLMVFASGWVPVVELDGSALSTNQVEHAPNDGWPSYEVIMKHIRKDCATLLNEAKIPIAYLGAG